MPTYNKQLQNIVRAYMESGQVWPASTHDIAKWAVNAALSGRTRSDGAAGW